MKETIMLCGAEPREILQSLVEKKIPAIMSYLSSGKWHVAKVLLSRLGAGRLEVVVYTRQRPRPVNIRVEQPVGVSIKYEYGKFIFETKVVGLEPSSDTAGGETGTPFCDELQNGSPTIVLAVPEAIEIVQRRSYYRVDVPESLKVKVVLWHRQTGRDTRSKEAHSGRSDSRQISAPERYWQGRLVDISAGGAQVAVNVAQRPDFRKGQFIGLRFTPMPYEKPVMLSAQIRNILPTADDKSLCLGLQIVGLEASLQGRDRLQRLCGVVERYYQINQTGVRQQGASKNLQLTT